MFVPHNFPSLFQEICCAKKNFVVPLLLQEGLPPPEVWVVPPGRESSGGAVELGKRVHALVFPNPTGGNNFEFKCLEASAVKECVRLCLIPLNFPLIAF